MSSITLDSEREVDYVDLLLDHLTGEDGTIDLTTTEPFTPDYFTSLESALSSILPTSSRWKPTLHKSSSELPILAPPPFRQILAEHLLFYLQHLRSYLSATAKAEWTESKGLDLRAMDHIYAYNHLPILAPAFVRRHRAGLLRAGQVRLIKAAYKSTMEELKLLVRLRSPPCMEGAEELLEACWRNYRLLEFLTAVRSERLEILMERYLDEEHVCLHVARGVGMATDERVYEEARRMKEEKGYVARYRHILEMSLYEERDEK